MKVTQPFRLLRSGLYLCLLALSACHLMPGDTVNAESIHNIERVKPDVALDIAYQLYQQDRHADALRGYHHVRDNSPIHSNEHRQALVGIALIHLDGGAEELYSISLATEQLEQLSKLSDQGNREPAAAEGLLIDTLRRLAEAESQQLALREQLESSEKAKAELRREKQQLEEALSRLRRLTLE